MLDYIYPHKIVIVDDNFIIREIIKKVIGSSSNLFTSENGVEGIGSILIIKPDVIVLDATLPKYAGLELIEYLITNKNILERNIPIILLHETERSILSKYSNLIQISKDNPRFLTILEKELQEKLIIDGNKKRFSFIQRVRKALGSKSINLANKVDMLGYKINNSIGILRIFRVIRIFFIEIFTSIWLSLYYLFSGSRIEDTNINQNRKDLLIYRVRVYPTLAIIFTALFFIILKLVAFVTGGFVLFNLITVTGF